MKMVYYKPVKETINTPALAEVIIKAVVWYHVLPNLIVSDRDSVFITKFWSLLCKFMRIKQGLSIIFDPQISRQTQRQNSTMKAYLRAFINFEQDDWAWLLPIAKFVYNNAKNISTDHTSFELNHDYHPQAYYRADHYLQKKPLTYARASKTISE